jgi:hypothetical protein
MPINTLFAAAQLNYVAIRVVHEHRHLPAFAKADRFCGIATSFVLNLDSAFDAGYIDSATHFSGASAPCASIGGSNR